MIYNVSTKFDNNDLEKVGFITQISEKLQKEEAIKIYPEFILLVRDVKELKLDGKQVKPDEYLNSILTREQNSSKLSLKKYILQNFKNRRCFKMTLPADFDYLDTLHQETVPLKENYLEDERVLKEYMIEKVDVKRLSSGSACTVKVFCGIIPAIVKKVEDGGIPIISSIHVRVAREENERLRRDVETQFEASLCNESTHNLYDSFESKATVLKEKFIQELTTNLVPEHEEQMQQFLQDFKAFADDRVQAVVSKKCQTELENCLNPILEKGVAEIYQPPDVEEQFRLDIDEARTHYRENLNYFGLDKAENFWKQKENLIRNCRLLLELRDSEWKSAQKLRENTEQQQRLKLEMEEIKSQLEREKKDKKGRVIEAVGNIFSGLCNLGAAGLNYNASLSALSRNSGVSITVLKKPPGTGTAV